MTQFVYEVTLHGYGVPRRGRKRQTILASVPAPSLEINEEMRSAARQAVLAKYREWSGLTLTVREMRREGGATVIAMDDRQIKEALEIPA